MTRPRCTVGALLLAAFTLAPGAAHADWSTVTFTSPSGKPARGIATSAEGKPEARLAIGCEDGDGGWRGVALLRTVAQPSDATEIGVTVSFFGREPVSERWSLYRASKGEEVAAPPGAESLRRSLLREESTRGNAAVTLDLRPSTGDPVQLRFALDGLATHSEEVAAACGGWGGPSKTRRRERGW